MPKFSEPSQPPKASPSKVPLYYAPWFDDPDPPDYMSDEDMDLMAEAIAEYMAQHQED